MNIPRSKIWLRVSVGGKRTTCVGTFPGPQSKGTTQEHSTDKEWANGQSLGATR